MVLLVLSRVALLWLNLLLDGSQGLSSCDCQKRCMLRLGYGRQGTTYPAQKQSTYVVLLFAAKKSSAAGRTPCGNASCGVRAPCISGRITGLAKEVVRCRRAASSLGIHLALHPDRPSHASLAPVQAASHRGGAAVHAHVQVRAPSSATHAAACAPGGSQGGGCATASSAGCATCP